MNMKKVFLGDINHFIIMFLLFWAFMSGLSFIVFSRHPLFDWAVAAPLIYFQSNGPCSTGIGHCTEFNMLNIIINIILVSIITGAVTIGITTLKTKPKDWV